MTDIIPPLTIEDHWCCHRKCPHVGDGVTCRECKIEKYGKEFANGESKGNHG